MNRRTLFLLTMMLCVAMPVYALYDVSDRGEWASSLPQELESLRNQAQTYVGPTAPNRHYAIRFTTRDEFEAAWPHLLKVKSKGAPIILVRGPSFFLADDTMAGVVVHSPPEGQSANPGTPEAPIPGQSDPRSTWMNTTYIELVVDGEIVDLDRIPLPANTQIIDERFERRPEK